MIKGYFKAIPMIHHLYIYNKFFILKNLNFKTCSVTLFSRNYGKLSKKSLVWSINVTVKVPTINDVWKLKQFTFE